MLSVTRRFALKRFHVMSSEQMSRMDLAASPGLSERIPMAARVALVHVKEHLRFMPSEFLAATSHDDELWSSLQQERAQRIRQGVRALLDVPGETE